MPFSLLYFVRPSGLRRANLRGRVMLGFGYLIGRRGAGFVVRLFHCVVDLHKKIEYSVNKNLYEKELCPLDNFNQKGNLYEYSEKCC